MQEGYIKYKAQWIKQAIEVDIALIDEIDFWRSRLVEKKWIGVYPDGIGYGNLSLRLKGSEFLISGSATGGLQKTNEQHYAVVEEFSLQRNWVKSKGKVPASSESLSHAALFNKPNVCRVMHIHNYELWNKYKDKLPSIGSGVEYGTPQMAYELQNIQQTIKDDYGVIIMLGHQEGLIAYGQTFQQLYYLLNQL